MAWWHRIISAPGPAQLARRRKTDTLGYVFHIELRMAQIFVRERNAQMADEVENVHADIFVKQPEQMATAGDDLRQSIQRPRLRGRSCDRVLNAMHGAVKMVTACEPW